MKILPLPKSCSIIVVLWIAGICLVRSAVPTLAQEDPSKAILEELAARLGVTISEIYPTNKIGSVAESGYFMSFDVTQSGGMSHAVRLFKLLDEYGAEGGPAWASRQSERNDGNCSKEESPFHGGTAYWIQCLDGQLFFWGYGQWVVDIELIGQSSPEALTVAETLFQIGVERGLFEGEQVSSEPALLNPQATCSLRPEIGRPLVLEVDLRNGDGSYLANQPVWIYGEGALGQLISLDNPHTSLKDWVAPGNTGLLAESSPYGRISLSAAIAINNSVQPISPQSPLAGRLIFSTTGAQGETIPLGGCDLTIDYIAMTNFYYGAIGYDPAGDAPVGCLTEVGLSGEPLAPKFRQLYNGDVLVVGSCGVQGSLGFSDGGIKVEYIDNTAVFISYQKPNWILLTDHPPYGEFIIGHQTTGLSISSDTSPLFRLGFNLVVDEFASEAAEYVLRFAVKRGMTPITFLASTYLGEVISDAYVPLTFQEKNLLALKVVRLRSLLEISYQPGEIRFRTFEGEPEVFSPDTGQSILLKAGEQVDPFRSNPVVTGFDPESAEQWWQETSWQGTSREGGENLPGWQAVVPEFDPRLGWFLLIFCGAALLGGIALLVLILLLRRPRQAATIAGAATMRQVPSPAMFYPATPPPPGMGQRSPAQQGNWVSFLSIGLGMVVFPLSIFMPIPFARLICAPITGVSAFVLAIIGLFSSRRGLAVVALLINLLILAALTALIGIAWLVSNNGALFG
jgi:hypothetical protein